MKRIDHRLPLAVVMLGGFALRVVRLDFQPLWWDEGYSMFFATRNFGTMLARTAVDIHPPLYYALLQFWMTFAGKSETAVRLLSVAIGVAAIPLIYALTLKLFSSQRVAFIAALVLALSPLHIYYSQEIRMYGLVTLLGMASVYLFVQLLAMPVGQLRTAIVVVAYIGVTAAALYTEYYAAFIVAFEIVTLAIYAIRSRWLIGSLAHWLIAFLAIAALYLPWVIYAGAKLYTYVIAKVAHESYTPLDLITFLAQHLAAFSVGHLTDWTWLAWGSIVLVALAVVGAATFYRGDAKVAENINGSSLRSPRFSVELCLLYLIVPLTLGYAINLIYPFHPIRNERLLLLAAPAFWILVALGIDALWHRRAWLAALALVVIAALSAASLYDFYTVPRYPNDDYRPLIAEVQQLAQPSDAFLAIYPWQIGYLETYYRGAPLNVVETPSDVWINQPAQMQRDLDALMARQPRIWLPAFQMLGRVLEDKLDANLRPRTYSIVDDWFGTTRLELFQRADDPPRAARALAFDDGVTLANWGVSTDAVAAGDGIVRVWFDASASTARAFTASLRLVDSSGNLWAQDDRVFDLGMQRIGLTIPIGTPPGEYDLRLAVYRSRDNQVLHLASDPSQSETLLARVQVVAPAQPNLTAVPHRTFVDFGDGIVLVGYVAPPAVQPGNPAPVTLFWQAARAIDQNYTVTLQAQSDRAIFGATQAAPARGIYSTTRWQPNEIVRDPQTITLRGDTPDGNYLLVATLFDNKTPSQTRIIGTVTVKGRVHYFGAPSPSTAFNARFDNLARLIGYDVRVDPQNVRLVLYWQALATTSTSYKVFAHLVDAQGATRAQRDQIPGDGVYPTTSWVAGEYLIDEYNIPLPADVTGMDLQIEIGMYDAATGARLPVFDGSNQPVGDYSVLPTRIVAK